MTSKNRKSTAALKSGRETRPAAPRTFLGKRLAEKRKKIVESGLPLLNWEELEKELPERRGGVLASESSLKKDWLRPEEDEAWRNL